jgi:hypothetical protein
MGLDWNPGNRPLPGSEAEVAELLAKFETSSGSAQQTLRERFFALTEAALTVVDAPVVGRDPAADRWYLAAWRRINGRQANEPTPLDAEEGAALGAARGLHVLALAPDCDGLPVYSNAGIDPELEAVSFRAQFLTGAVEIIGDELLARAYRRMSAPQLLDYGEALLERARLFAREHGCTEQEERRLPPQGDDGSPAARVHIVFAAAKWCRYWGARGFMLDPWY